MLACIKFLFFRSLQLLVLPLFFIGVILWAVMFSQFWKRKNSALLARLVKLYFGINLLSIFYIYGWSSYMLFEFHFYRWQISYSAGVDLGHKLLGIESPVELLRKWGTDKTNEKEAHQRNEWFGCLMRFRNDAMVILSIICLQLPFELAYAHLYEVIGSDIMK